MLTYLIRRLLLVVPTVLSVYTVTFALIHATPGGPWDTEDLPLSPEAIANIKAKYNLDAPLWDQYVSYLSNALHGDFGPSYANAARDVGSLVRESFPVSFQLALLAMALALIIGLSLGVLAALRHNTWLDHTAMLVAVTGISTPTYVLVTLLVFGLAVQMRLVPVFGWNGIWDSRILIPTVALSVRPAATIARYTRSSVLEVLHQDFIRTAHAKGLARSTVIRRHLMKNAMVPVLTVTGISFGYVVTGSFFVETIYNVPGIGHYFVSAALGRDYPVLMAVTLIYSVVVVVASLLVDIGYVLLDPRISYR